jgi:REP element-mobilizing transposase RayT
MARGNERKPVFRDDRDREEYLIRLARYRRKFRFQLLAYCLMPNHVHLAIRRSDQPLSRAMLSLQSSYAHWFNRRHERVGHLFEGRYKAVLVQEERYLFAMIGYIHMNPVRAGIVQRSEAFPWSSDRSLFGGGAGACFFDRDATRELLGLTARAARKPRRSLWTTSLAEEYERLPEIGQLVKGDEEFGVERIRTGLRTDPGADSPLKGLSEESVVSAVAGATGMAVGTIRGRTRHVRLSSARSIAGYVGKDFASISLRRMARYLGRDDSYLCRQVSLLEGRMEREPEVRREVESVLARLRPAQTSQA